MGKKIKNYKIAGSMVLLTVLFLVLKATDVITMGWVWVFSPLWISLSVLLFMLLVIEGFERRN